MSTILIGGGTGLIGQRLCKLLTEHNHEVRLLSRSVDSNSPYQIFKWDPIAGQIDEKALDGVDTIINIAGAGIADKAWTAKRKKLIIDSRVKGNELLAATLAANNQKVKAFISASAVGYYGDRGNEKLTESAAPGNDGFLSESCMLWEASAQKAIPVTDRLAVIRIGVVLSTKGGALEKMLIPFNFGVGNYFGDGTAYMSWVHIEDISRLFVKAVEDAKMEGTYNGVSPEAVTGKRMAEAIKEAKGSFALIMPVPEFALKVAMGERVAMLTDSANVIPQETQAAGFTFKYPQLVPALKNILKEKV